MQEMGITVGPACKDYVRRVTNKQRLDKQRKSSKDFKHQRRKMLTARRAKGKQKEQKEGLTYGSGIAIELTALEDEVVKLLGNIQPEDAQKAVDAASLPDASREELSLPKKKPPSNAEVFFFDLETSSRSRD